MLRYSILSWLLLLSWSDGTVGFGVHQTTSRAISRVTSRTPLLTRKYYDDEEEQEEEAFAYARLRKREKRYQDDEEDEYTSEKERSSTSTTTFFEVEDDDIDDDDDVIIPNPLLDGMDPAGAAERFPELARDPRFWMEAGLYFLFVNIVLGSYVDGDEMLYWW